MDGPVRRKYPSTPAKPQPSGCVVLERLTKARAVGFADYLNARHFLSVCSQDRPVHQAAVENFEAARQAFRLSQRAWEQHVAEHHLG